MKKIICETICIDDGFNDGEISAVIKFLENQKQKYSNAISVYLNEDWLDYETYSNVLEIKRYETDQEETIREEKEEKICQETRQAEIRQAEIRQAEIRQAEIIKRKRDKKNINRKKEITKLQAKIDKLQQLTN